MVIGGFRAIGACINANRATLIQSAGTLITRATEDNLPGFTIAGKVAAIQTLLDAYKATQAEGSEEKAEFKRHDEAGQAVGFINLDTGDVMDAELGSAGSALPVWIYTPAFSPSRFAAGG